MFGVLGDLGKLIGSAGWLILTLPLFVIGYFAGIVLSSFHSLLAPALAIIAVVIFLVAALPSSTWSTDVGGNPLISHKVEGQVVEKSWWGLRSTPQPNVSVQFKSVLGQTYTAATDSGGFYAITVPETSYYILVVDQQGDIHQFNKGQLFPVKSDLVLNIEWSV